MKTLKTFILLGFLASISLFDSCKKDSIDTEDPMINILSPTDGQTIDNGLMELQATITDNVNLKNIQIQVTDMADGSLVFESTENLTGQAVNISESIPLDVPEGGNFELAITATDAADNTVTEKINTIASPTNRGVLDLNFRLQYDGETLITFQNYDYPGAAFPFHISLLSVYIAHVNMIGNAGNTEVLEIERLRINENHAEQATAEQGATISIPHLIPGDFSGISFGIGVPPSLNAQSPINFPQNHPLFFSGEYWDSWDSYIFFKIEGKADLDNDGSKETNIALHSGSDVAYQIKNMDMDFSIEAQQTTSLKFIIDVKDIFDNNGVIYDLATTPQIHSLTQINEATELAENLKEAIQ